MTKGHSFGAARRYRVSRRQALMRLVGGGATLAAISSAACSSKPKTGGPAASSARGNTQPQPGGTLVPYMMNNSPLDPHKASAGAQSVVAPVMSRPFRFKTEPDTNSFADHNLENDLGMSAESPDAITWTIKLRTDAKFQNVAPVNGHAVQAEDIKATFTRALDPATNNPNRGSLNMIDAAQIQAPATDTVVFKLNYPYAPFQRTLASPAYSWIFPREVLTGGYDPTKQVIGSGPFMADSFTPDVAYAYKKNPDWFDGGGRPYVDALKFAIIPDAAQRLAQFSAGNLDELIIDDPFDFATAKQQSPQAATFKALYSRPNPIYLQLGDPSSPFQDIRVRQALSMAIDRDALAKTIYGGDALQTVFVPAYMGKWAVLIKDLDANTAQYYKYNPAQAKQLLQAAGAAELQLRFGYIGTGPFSTPAYIKLAQSTASMLNEVGIKTVLVNQDYNRDFIDSGKGSRQGYFDKDFVLFGGIGVYTESDEYLFTYFHSKSTGNQEHLNDPNLDAMIDKERTIVDENARFKAVVDIQKYLASKLYAVPTTDGYEYVLIQPRVQNYLYTNSLGKGTETYASIWLKR